VNCIQKFPRPCLYSSGVIARKWPNDSATRGLQHKTSRGFSMNPERRPALAAAICYALWCSNTSPILWFMNRCCENAKQILPSIDATHNAIGSTPPSARPPRGAKPTHTIPPT
jgi:hypothetical protein